MLVLLSCFASFSAALGGRLVVMLSPVTAVCKQKMHLLWSVHPAWKQRYCVYCLPTTSDVSAPLRAGVTYFVVPLGLEQLGYGTEVGPFGGEGGVLLGNLLPPPPSDRFIGLPG